ncbi:MAG: 50S ribosomal protein L1 [Candidatus Babeliales bacterium]|jgi:large subunit ribosomal protein L1
MKRGKNYKRVVQGHDKTKMLSLDDAVTRMKEKAYAKFDESVDVDINVGIDPSKGDQVVRGAVTLPHGTGKKVRVVVFAKGEHVDQALKAGADYVGLEELIDKISAGWMDFEYAVATPDVMGPVGKLAKQLGPRGLLPNKKVGTVTFDVEHIVKELKSGRSFFKNDKNAVVHFSLGKRSFDEAKLKENIRAFLKALSSSKPPASKGKFIRKVTISSTMGVGICVNADDILR